MVEFVVENLEEMGPGCATAKGQHWKSVKGIGVGGAKQQGQRDTSLREEKENLAMGGGKDFCPF